MESFTLYQVNFWPQLCRNIFGHLGLAQTPFATRRGANLESVESELAADRKLLRGAEAWVLMVQKSTEKTTWDVSQTL